jgi:hypothetical protein
LLSGYVLWQANLISYGGILPLIGHANWHRVDMVFGEYVKNQLPGINYWQYGPHTGYFLEGMDYTNCWWGPFANRFSRYSMVSHSHFVDWRSMPWWVMNFLPHHGTYLPLIYSINRSRKRRKRTFCPRISQGKYASSSPILIFVHAVY